MAGLLQANLNHCREAQDLWIQSLLAGGYEMGVAAEPWRVPSNSNWASDTSGSVAIHRVTATAPPLSILGRDRGVVVVEWGGLVVAACYISPNCGFASFERFLDGVGRWISANRHRPMMVLGDFNAKSALWGSPRTDRRGRALGEWAASFDLWVINRGSEHTCVRRSGGSIVDITLASPEAQRRIEGWKVLTGVETASDHRYISMVVSASTHPTPSVTHGRPGQSSGPRWSLRRLDGDFLTAAALAVSWPEHSGPRSVRGLARWLRESMSLICDCSMPRISPPRQGRKTVYWWSGDIEALRAECVVARRQYTRERRRGPHSCPARAAELYEGYREKRRALGLAVRRAKTQAWEELLASVDRDPWGRPYRVVMGRLRPWAPPLTESLDPQLLGDIVSALFPDGDSGAVHPPEERTPWHNDLGVTDQELTAAVRRMCARNTAPGPDGVPGKALGLALKVLGPQVRQLFDECLKTGRLPRSWKEARLVLLPKQGKPAESPSAYRPICLLNETGKLFERVLSVRLGGHLSRTGPDLSEAQYGFREGRSTIDAIERVKALAETAVDRGGVALAVSLDIANAFNSLPWRAIGGALEKHQVPPYLRAVLGDYFRDRTVRYTGRGAVAHRRDVRRGVPQGSVLGPILWNLGYNAVLRRGLPTGVAAVCYADDTLVLAWGGDWQEARERAVAGTGQVVRRIRALGLKVALDKTEAMWFHGLRNRPPLSHMRVEGVRIGVGSQMKYLGLILDSRWRFREHLEAVAPKVEGVASALGRLLPNLRGPRDRARRMYAGVCQSVALYGAPIWAGAAVADRRCRVILARCMRRLVIRVARGYRTLSLQAACVLASVPPPHLLAEMHAEVYRARVHLRQGEDPTVRTIADYARALEVRRRQARRSMIERWQQELLDVSPESWGHRIVGAVQPVLHEWLGRGWGEPSYRVSQVLTGHGCFGEYLCRIGREMAATCHHCGADQDTAQHTLAECSAFAEERRVLIGVVGEDLSLPALIDQMISREENWKAVVSFCEQVMLQKETAERERERGQEEGANSRLSRRPQRPRGQPRQAAPERRQRGSDERENENSSSSSSPTTSSSTGSSSAETTSSAESSLSSE